jgi:hypothetical protein
MLHIKDARWQMENNGCSGWYCDNCGKEFFWGDKAVVLSGGVVSQEHSGPMVDENPWWGVYHDSCYEKNTEILTEDI